MRYFIATLIFIVIAVVSILGFRSDKFSKPPVWVFDDMDIQTKYSPQGKNEFFPDKRDDRPVIPGTVGRGYGWEVKEVFEEGYGYAVAEKPAMYSGKDEKGDWLRGYPIEIDEETMELGQQKFDIFCAICHGEAGDGNGITKQYGMAATPTYLDERIRNMPEGEIFNTITNGKNLMGSYGAALTPKERWAVIAYVRALQLAGGAHIDDVPAQYHKELGL